ncbi:MAG: LuxR C-terminal-related transcriptional regulator [Slackia sp.]|nr:LuxR C-terminal-related transcriptional regulator [Slackia sp.]
MRIGENVEAWIRCFILMTMALLEVSLLNQSVYPCFMGVFPLAREVATVGSIAGTIVIPVVFSKGGKGIVASRCFACALLAFAGGGAAAFVACTLDSAALLCAGSFVMNMGRSFTTVAATVSMVRLDGVRTALCVACSLLGSYFFGFVFQAFPNGAGLLVFSFIPFAIAALSYRMLLPLIGRIASVASLDGIALVEPRSFLPRGHVLFASFFVFRLAYGCALTFNVGEGVPVFPLMPLVPLAVLALWTALKRGAGPADMLYLLAALSVFAGLLCMLVPRLSVTTLVYTFLFTGSDCFTILMYYVIAALGRRNVLQSFSVVAWGQCASASGTLAGTVVGHGISGALALDIDIAAIVVAFVALLFFAFNMTALRSFGFEETIQSIEAVSDVALGEGFENDDADRRFSDIVDKGCEEAVRRCGLTGREADVLALLARGRNVPFIEEELVISRNTIRTHVKHIYQKTEVHSQQELIDFVEACGCGWKGSSL